MAAVRHFLIVKNECFCHVISIAMRLWFACKFSLKSDNLLLSYGQKRFFKWRASTILNLKKMSTYGRLAVIQF